jgi:hypothetical protein
MTENEYYVYLYLREDGTPYYVGKGKDNRAFRRRDYGQVQRPNDDCRILFHAKDLSEHDAFILEKELIAKYGRKDNGTGILRNRTDGGEGASGAIVTDETKIKLSENMKVRMNTPEMKAQTAAFNTRTKKGKTLSEEHKNKMSESHKERWKTYQFSEETIIKLSERVSGENNPSKRPEVRKKISDWAKKRMNDPNYTYKLSDAGRKSLQEKFAGENNPAKRPEVRAKMRATWARKRAEKLQASANLTEFFISDPVSD